MFRVPLITLLNLVCWADEVDPCETAPFNFIFVVDKTSNSKPITDAWTTQIQETANDLVKKFSSSVFSYYTVGDVGTDSPCTQVSYNVPARFLLTGWTEGEPPESDPITSDSTNEETPALPFNEDDARAQGWQETDCTQRKDILPEVVYCALRARAETGDTFTKVMLIITNDCPATDDYQPLNRDHTIQGAFHPWNVPKPEYYVEHHNHPKLETFRDLFKNHKVEPFFAIAPSYQGTWSYNWWKSELASVGQDVETHLMWMGSQSPQPSFYDMLLNARSGCDASSG